MSTPAKEHIGMGPELHHLESHAQILAYARETMEAEAVWHTRGGSGDSSSGNGNSGNGNSSCLLTGANQILTTKQKMKKLATRTTTTST